MRKIKKNYHHCEGGDLCMSGGGAGDVGKELLHEGRLVVNFPRNGVHSFVMYTHTTFNYS